MGSIDGTGTKPVGQDAREISKDPYHRRSKTVKITSTPLYHRDSTERSICFLSGQDWGDTSK